MTPSIRRQLIVALLATIAVAVLAAAYGSYRLARAGIDEVFDYHLRQIALSLRDHAPQSHTRLAVTDDELDFVIQVFDRDGKRRYSSLPNASLPGHSQPGFSTAETEDGRWRIYAIQLNDQIVQVAQPTRVRREAAAAAALRTVMPFLVLLPVLGALIWWTVGIGLVQLGRLAHDVKSRSAVQLEPLPLAEVPVEARPLIEALNDLLKRLSAALAAQRAFIADAAHELRTPLTALQLQAKLIERANTQPDRAAAVADLKRGLVRASHVVQQLLTLAREEPGGGSPRSYAHVDLVSLAGIVAADYTLLAESRGIDLGLGKSVANATVSGDADALRTLIANLLENAIRYTPGPGRVDIAVAVEGPRPSLTISDSGPGIPEKEREKVFDRFYRRTEFAEPGSGLGLAIVRAIADRHGASIELAASPLGGLLVSVRFPPV
ncbi:MAG: two-component sensor histidine kinase [Rhodocyclaceae bacterium]|nr:MAG: two-component sensor histidine kinase [Rhodocyclaceae bacterium]